MNERSADVLKHGDAPDPHLSTQATGCFDYRSMPRGLTSAQCGANGETNMENINTVPVEPLRDLISSWREWATYAAADRCFPCICSTTLT